MSATYKTTVHAAKKLAALVGTAGAQGGWIYDYRGRKLCQGWRSYADLMLRKGYLETTDDGLCTLTQKAQEAAEKAPALQEDHRVAQLKKKLSEAAQAAQEALAELERRGPCERSMNAAMRVEFAAKDITKISDEIDWKC